MRRRTLRSLMILGLLVMPLVAHTQPSGKVYRLGVLATTYWPPFDAFREGLRELGYIEGHNLTLEYRWAEQRTPLFPDLATDLVQSEVDLIVTWGTPAAQAAKQATGTLLIVMAASGDALRTGLVTSLTQPGGNLTELSALNLTLENKRLSCSRRPCPEPPASPSSGSRPIPMPPSC
jgi:putative tryptophan/tyrosine transport system substrate-binding protein